MLLPPEGEARLGQHRLSRREIGFCRAQRIVLNLGVEAGDDLAWFEDIPDMDRPLDHPAVEAKSEADLVLGADMARQRDDLAFGAVLDGDRPHGPCLGGRWGHFFATRRGDSDQCGYCDPRRVHWRCLSPALSRRPSAPGLHALQPIRR